ncbi:hypothetical protein HYH03_008485 [Edaphochlamys debaryana]|uniref:Uncharacterized protein n=1 Tax=Edaphochlamys debaryana TaxID=47281 RepID=A0A835XYD4_9CHLO|nr:hypothetical protein HYH03_008485 [Edaphochlamys debaryana]|eukprot:KAG2493352.1 hypothetical protein HYH03_008485 [Edaphochlamys debaryana]
MVSEASGLADRLTCSLTVMLYAILTNRTYEYVWYGHHVLWESLSSPYIDWRSPPRDQHEGTQLVRDANGTVLPHVTENYWWSKPGRTELLARKYVDPSNATAKEEVRQLFAEVDLMSYGKEYDTVIWTSNNGLLRWMVQNPFLAPRLTEMNLTMNNAVRCLFNFAYTPSPAALAPFRQGDLLDKLLDPNNFVIGIQMRLGDHIFKQDTGHIAEGHRSYRPDAFIGEPYFACALELTAQLEALPEFGGKPSRSWGDYLSSLVLSASGFRLPWFGRRSSSGSNRPRSERAGEAEAQAGGSSSAAGGPRNASVDQSGSAPPPPRKVYWFLVSDSAAVRKAARERFGGSGRLLVAEDLPLDHVNDYSRNGQVGLHVAAGELWLFGLAHIHIITPTSTYGRLGAMAGLNQPNKMYSMFDHKRRRCLLTKPDRMEEVATWSTGVRRRG